MRAQERRLKPAGKSVLDLILSDGCTYPYKGDVAFADRQVDERTGTIRVAAIFPNPQNLLRPGMFSRVRAEMGIKKAALVIPQRAVTEIQGRYVVAVANPDNKVAIKPVKVGQRFGQLWVVDEGLQVGEKVVAEGTQKVGEVDNYMKNRIPIATRQAAGSRDCQAAAGSGKACQPGRGFDLIP